MRGISTVTAGRDRRRIRRFQRAGAPPMREMKFPFSTAENGGDGVTSANFASNFAWLGMAVLALAYYVVARPSHKPDGGRPLALLSQHGLVHGVVSSIKALMSPMAVICVALLCFCCANEPSTQWRVSKPLGKARPELFTISPSDGPSSSSEVVTPFGLLALVAAVMTLRQITLAQKNGLAAIGIPWNRHAYREEVPTADLHLIYSQSMKAREVPTTDLILEAETESTGGASAGAVDPLYFAVFATPPEAEALASCDTAHSEREAAAAEKREAAAAEEREAEWQKKKKAEAERDAAQEQARRAKQAKAFAQAARDAAQEQARQAEQSALTSRAAKTTAESARDLAKAQVLRFAAWPHALQRPELVAGAAAAAVGHAKGGRRRGDNAASSVVSTTPPIWENMAQMVAPGNHVGERVARARAMSGGGHTVAHTFGAERMRRASGSELAI